MKKWKVMVLIGILTVVLVTLIAGCGSSNNTAENNQSSVAPYKVDLSWGTFKLNPRIATKIKNKQPLNFVLSFITLSAVGAPAELALGMKTEAKLMEEKYGVTINTRVIGPTVCDTPKQIAELDSLLTSNQVDALFITPVTSNAFVSIINKAMDQGIPTWTVNTDSPASHRICYYGPNDTPTGNGADLAKYTLDWAKQKGFDIKVAALVTGDDTADWAQGRMEAWVNVMTKAVPGIKIYGTPTNALTTGYDASKVYADVKAFLIGHPDVNFVFDTDWGGVPIAQAIKDLGLEGKVYVVAYNIDNKIVNFVGKSALIGTCDQNFPGQSAAAVKGAAEFFFEGKVPSETIQYVPAQMLTPDNVEKIKSELGQVLGLQ